MKFSIFPRLYPILDAGFLAIATEDRAAFLKDLIPGLADAGVTLLQYRNKQGNEAEILREARLIRSLAGDTMRLILNDWPALAVEAGFDGVHVGQGDMAPGMAREIAGPDRIVGVSTHSQAQLRAADAEPVDYIAIGPVFSTTSKENPDPVIGLAGVTLARSITRKPIVAIGGITVETGTQVYGAGADSLAVISAIFRPGIDAAKLAKDFLDIFR